VQTILKLSKNGSLFFVYRFVKVLNTEMCMKELGKGIPQSLTSG
jgi:hypothetical protein